MSLSLLGMFFDCPRLSLFQLPANCQFRLSCVTISFPHFCKLVTMPLNCLLCSKSFTQKRYLTQHENARHPRQNKTPENTRILDKESTDLFDILETTLNQCDDTMNECSNSSEMHSQNQPEVDSTIQCEPCDPDANIEEQETEGVDEDPGNATNQPQVKMPDLTPQDAALWRLSQEWNLSFGAARAVARYFEQIAIGFG
jgi:hypothetical protein